MGRGGTVVIVIDLDISSFIMNFILDTFIKKTKRLGNARIKKALFLKYTSEKYGLSELGMSKVPTT